ncbi:nucleoredoxin-like protein 1 isoform X2 [Betta splendens]|uniref:Nucleoredoxin-like protein 1 isoform X2 n=1 Tax=Betta splendens TaxID=158456 RepID=A0A9W2XWV1_BETSP|nr:nucleoredoxin-like protein 1 isoform X2 [Betta splendens]
MVDLFINRVLVRNNREQDELDTEREVVMRLENRVLMLLFAAAECEGCRRFAPALKDFFKKLTDQFYVDRSAQLVLLYVRELGAMFNVEELPTVVVLRPDGSILIPNAVEEILRLGPGCYRNWQEAAELIDRSFMVSEDFEDRSRWCSFSEPVRRLKYKVENEKKKKQKRTGRGRDGGGEDAEVDGGTGGGGGGSPW